MPTTTPWLAISRLSGRIEMFARRGKKADWLDAFPNTSEEDVYANCRFFLIVGFYRVADASGLTGGSHAPLRDTPEWLASDFAGLCELFFPGWAAPEQTAWLDELEHRFSLSTAEQVSRGIPVASALLRSPEGFPNDIVFFKQLTRKLETLVLAWKTNKNSEPVSDFAASFAPMPSNLAEFAESYRKKAEEHGIDSRLVAIEAGVPLSDVF